MPCCLCIQDFTALSSKKKLLLHGKLKARENLKRVLEEFCFTQQSIRLESYAAFSETASLCHLCQTELKQYSNLQKNLETCTTGIIQKLENLETTVVIQRRELVSMGKRAVLRDHMKLDQNQVEHLWLDHIKRVDGMVPGLGGDYSDRHSDLEVLVW